MICVAWNRWLGFLDHLTPELPPPTPGSENAGKDWGAVSSKQKSVCPLRAFRQHV